jgi:beta-lactamase class A
MYRFVSVSIASALAASTLIAGPATAAAPVTPTDGATATATDGATATGAVLVDQRAVLAAAVPAAITAFINARGGHSAVAVRDLVTGASVAVNQNRIFQTASIVKFDILATRLYQVQHAGTALSAGQKRLAFAMITQSDNNAASALYAADRGASGVASANRAFGLIATAPNSAWGRTHTTPADQLRLLSAVMRTNSPLSAANRDYMLSLMSRVEKDQAWGITAAATPDATAVYVKNGWVEMNDYGHMQGDNSIGRIIEPGHDWLIAVMSNYNRSDAAGEALLGQLAQLAVSGLRAETASPTT